MEFSARRPWCGKRESFAFPCLPFSFNASLTIFSFIMHFFWPQAHTGCILTGPRFISIHKTPGPATSSMVRRAQLAGGSKLVRLVTKSDGIRRASVRVIFPLSWPHSISPREHVVSNRPVTAMPPLQEAPEDYRTPPSWDIWRSRILSILHPNSHWPRPTKPCLFLVPTKTTRACDSELSTPTARA